jgi:hypothetical protein
MKRYALMLAPVLALAAGVASAQGGGGGGTPPTFDAIDKDKNGSLSLAEVTEWAKGRPAGPNGAPDPAQILGRWDAGKNGSVSKAEFDNRPRGGVAAVLRAWWRSASGRRRRSASGSLIRVNLEIVSTSSAVSTAELFSVVCGGGRDGAQRDFVCVSVTSGAPRAARACA